MVSLSYIWTVFWSKTFFGEKLTSAKVYALGLILFGVALLGMGTR
jgi:multidrug transporter EmrE-like cation transporter